MKALILAAGFGKRLQPITNSIPKSMVEVNNTPLLINSLRALKHYNVDEIGIVVGHMADYIQSKIRDNFEGIPVVYFNNADYLTTNNVYSLYKALPFCNDELLMLECDIFYQKEMLLPLVQRNADCSILVSPFNPETMDGTVVRVQENRAVELILGKWQDENFDYSSAFKTVNMYHFSKDFITKYIQLVKWYVENISTQSYYEKLLGTMIYLKEFDFRVVQVPEEMWCEIDNADDLSRANSIFRNK